MARAGQCQPGCGVTLLTSSQMNMDLSEYVSAGYYLSRYAGFHDCTGIELRRVTMACEHSQRKFFPGTWALSWCNDDDETRIAEAAHFGIGQEQLPGVIAWADDAFDRAFGAWNVFFRLEDAREAANRFLQQASDVELWGLGLHRSFLTEFTRTSAPPPSSPGYAPTGACGMHIAACRISNPLEAGGMRLGHEVLIGQDGQGFNSPESRHLDECAMVEAVGIKTNEHGLIDRFEDAMACCKHLDSHAAETQHQITGWRPWLIVRYPI